CRYGNRTALWTRQTERPSFAVGRSVAPSSARTLIEDAAERWTRSEINPPALPTVAKRVAHLEVLLGIRDHEIHPRRTPATASAAFASLPCTTALLIPRERPGNRLSWLILILRLLRKVSFRLTTRDL